jgi:hypothetical protein
MKEVKSCITNLTYDALSKWQKMLGKVVMRMQKNCGWEDTGNKSSK